MNQDKFNGATWLQFMNNMRQILFLTHFADRIERSLIISGGPSGLYIRQHPCPIVVRGWLVGQDSRVTLILLLVFPNVAQRKID